MYLQTKAFILNTQDRREGDRLYNLFTQEAGKLTAQARGVRKPQSKLSGHLQSFSRTNIHLAHGKYFYQIIGAQNDYSFNVLPTAHHHAYASYFLELVDSLTRHGQKSDTIFEMMSSAFSLLEVLGDELHMKQLRLAFVLKLLKETGFNPEERIERNASIQEVLSKYLTESFEDIVSTEPNGELKVLFNITQYSLNEVIERPLNSVLFLRSL